MVMNLGPAFGNKWCIYFTATNPDSLSGTVSQTERQTDPPLTNSHPKPWLPLVGCAAVWYRGRVMLSAACRARDTLLGCCLVVLLARLLSAKRRHAESAVPLCCIVQVNHVTMYRTSADLMTWSDAAIAFDGGSDGNNFGGPTESPFVVRSLAGWRAAPREGAKPPVLHCRFAGRAISTCFRAAGAATTLYVAGITVSTRQLICCFCLLPLRQDTRVFVSTNPFDFGSIPLGTAKQVGEIGSHAPEVNLPRT